MPNSVRVLFAGESWMTHSVHVKGFDSFDVSTYNEGATEMIAALRQGGADVTYLPNHIAGNQFPLSAQDLAKWNVVILSDIGANTLLLPDRSFIRSEATANRLDLIAGFVENGGGLLMIGGYLTFQGIQAKGNYCGTAVDRILPVSLSPHDDRVETPQGSRPVMVDPTHPVAEGLTNWPVLLGYNRARLRPEGHLVATLGDDPLIAVRQVEAGRSAIFASDCGPHWGPPAFVGWEGYGHLWNNLVRWLAGTR